MSKFFLSAGLLVIAALFTALIGPYFVDWTAYRSTFEAYASRTLGQPVTIAGKASVRLLPTPTITFTDIRIGGGPEPLGEIERFRAVMELAPLLKGEVRIIQMSVERPHLRFDIAEPFGIELAGAGSRGVDPSRVSLGQVQIFGGSASVIDSAAGRSWEVTEADGMIEADSLRGPAKIDGSLVIDGVPFEVAVALGSTTDAAIPAKVMLASSRLPVTLTADGALDWSNDGAMKYVAAATITAAPPQQGKEALPSIWDDLDVKGVVELTREALTVTAAQLTYGATEHPLVINTSGRFDLGARPSFDLKVEARQIDLDGAMAGGERPAAEIVAELVGLLEGARTMLPGTLQLAAQGVVLREGLVEAVTGNIATDADGWRIENASAVFPGETRVEAEGLLGIAGSPSFKGHFSVASSRPAALAAWWRGAAGSATSLGSFSVEADVDVGAESQTLSNLRASIGEGNAQGSVAFYRFREPDAVAGESATRFADVTLSADRLDAIEARAFVELIAGRAGLPQGLNHVTLSLRADALTAGDIEAQSVMLDGGLEGDTLQIRQFSVANLAGAAISASGTLTAPWSAPSGSLEAKFDAEDLTGAASFVARVFPENEVVARLTRVAPRLSPAHADVSARLGAADGANAFNVTGSFAETHLTLDTAWTGMPETIGDIAGAVTLHIDGADTAAVLRQFGVEALPIASGPLVVDATLGGRLTSDATLDLSGTMAGVSFDYQAAATGGEETLAGAFTAQSEDTTGALLLMGLAPPGLGEPLPAMASGQLELALDRIAVTLDRASFAGQDVAGSIAATFEDGVSLSGTLDLDRATVPALLRMVAGDFDGDDGGGGPWSDAAIVPNLPPSLGVDIRVTADALDLGVGIPASAAELNLAFAQGRLNIGIVEASFVGGALTGAIGAAFAEGEADVTLRGALEGGQLHALVWERNRLPVASGRLDASFEAGASGRSIAGLVSAVSGSGSFSIADGRIDSLNPQALPAVMQMAQSDEAPNTNAARETFFRLIRAGGLDFGETQGSFAIAGGIVDVATVALSAPGTVVHADAAIDLNALSLSSDWVLRVAEDGGDAETSQVTVPIHFAGPLADPAQDFDLNPLFARLNARYAEYARIRLEELEAERRRLEEAEARRQALPAGLQGEVEQRQRQRVQLPPRAIPEEGAFLPPDPGMGSLLQAMPQDEVLAPAESSIIDLLGPSLDDMLTGTP